MSVTISDYIKKCELVNRQILDEQERIVLANENRIVSLNVDAFQDGLGSDDKVLQNTNKVFPGYFSGYNYRPDFTLWKVSVPHKFNKTYSCQFNRVTDYAGILPKCCGLPSMS